MFRVPYELRLHNISSSILAITLKPDRIKYGVLQPYFPSPHVSVFVERNASTRSLFIIIYNFPRYNPLFLQTKPYDPLASLSLFPYHIFRQDIFQNLHELHQRNIFDISLQEPDQSEMDYLVLIKLL